MLDIIFISYDEPDADDNFARLTSRFPHARRVHGVKGIANAHIAAAKKAMTRFFYVVDADAVIRPDFDFSFKPDQWEEEYVHLWHAKNPVGLTYGYGGVKLFSKAMFKSVKTQVDFTTTLTKDIKIHPEIACDTIFNMDPIRAFRGAFREGAKLIAICDDHTKPMDIRNEAAYRLGKWTHPDPCAFDEFIIEGAKAGRDYAIKKLDSGDKDISFINEHEIIAAEIEKKFPNVEYDLDPTPRDELKSEYFFTSRIAASLYDPFVLSSLPLTELRDALSDGQLFSKRWLISKMKEFVPPNTPKVAILGGWIGTLGLMMHAYDLDVDITSIDLDARANRIAMTLNYDHKFKTLQADMYEVDYNEYDIIINTSSEHIPDIEAWAKKIPEGKMVIVQNNNFEEGEGHVSCVRNSVELRTKLGLKEVLFEGTIEFPQYRRFMLIGTT